MSPWNVNTPYDPGQNEYSQDQKKIRGRNELIFPTGDAQMNQQYQKIHGSQR